MERLAAEVDPGAGGAPAGLDVPARPVAPDAEAVRGELAAPAARVCLAALVCPDVGDAQADLNARGAQAVQACRVVPVAPDSLADEPVQIARLVQDARASQYDRDAPAVVAVPNLLRASDYQDARSVPVLGFGRDDPLRQGCGGPVGPEEPVASAPCLPRPNQCPALHPATYARAEA